MKKRCELCSQLAQMYCQSDNASLCYDCDQNVHSANFLVTKHSRILLCHRCQSPTPWTASGLNIGRAAAVCVNCLDEDSSQRRILPGGETSHRGNDIIEETRDAHEDADTEDENTESSDENESEDEDAENQVVPWSSVASPPVAASLSSVEYSSSEFSSDAYGSAIKRQRLNAYIDSEDYTECSSDH